MCLWNTMPQLGTIQSHKVKVKVTRWSTLMLSDLILGLIIYLLLNTGTIFCYVWLWHTHCYLASFDDKLLFSVCVSCHTVKRIQHSLTLHIKVLQNMFHCLIKPMKDLLYNTSMHLFHKLYVIWQLVSDHNLLSSTLWLTYESLIQVSVVTVCVSRIAVTFSCLRDLQAVWV